MRHRRIAVERDQTMEDNINGVKIRPAAGS